MARQDDAASERQLAAVAAGHRRAVWQRHIGRGFAQPGGVDDLARHPDGVGLARHRFDHPAEQAVAVVRVLEAGVRLDRRCLRQRRAQLFLVGEGAPAQPLIAGQPVAHDARAVQEQLAQPHLGQRRVEPGYVRADLVVQTQRAALAQLHDSRGRERLGVRGDTNAMARRQRRAGGQVGAAESRLEDDLSPVRHRDHAARLLEQAHLEFDPARQVVQRRRKPVGHRAGG